MARGFKCDVDLTLHLVSSLGNYECCGEYVYLSIEMFGTVHKTQPQRAYYPLVFNEIVNFSKTFWSPKMESEVLDMLEDAPMVIELRRIDPCFHNGLLLAYYDGNTREFLFSPYSRVPCANDGKEVYMERTIDFKGTSPRLRFSSYTDIKRLGGSSNDFGDSFRSTKLANKSLTRSDEGYDSPLAAGTLNSSYNSHKGGRSRRSGGSVSRPTVSSAMRSRSPSPVPMRGGGVYSEEDGGDDGQSEEDGASEDARPPFVVRHVPDSLLTRSPSLHDGVNYSTGRSSRRASPRKRSASPRRRTKAGAASTFSGSKHASKSLLKRSSSYQGGLNNSKLDLSSSNKTGGLGYSSPRTATKSKYSGVIDTLDSYRPSRVASKSSLYDPLLTSRRFCYICDRYHYHDDCHHHHSHHHYPWYSHRYYHHDYFPYYSHYYSHRYPYYCL